MNLQLPSNSTFLLTIIWLLGLISGNVDCKSNFAIGERFFGDRLLLRDELENRHTGLTETPRIDFNYSIKEPITSIEIFSEENVSAVVHFSYYDALIKGTVTAESTTMTATGGNVPFKIIIRIYGFNETTPAFYSTEILRQNKYDGLLTPQPEPGVIDHMEMIEDVHKIGNQNAEILDESTEDDQDEDEDEDEESFEEDDEFYETFASADRFINVGRRIPGDHLLYQTSQVSDMKTEHPTKHSVTFYFIDSSYITFIEFDLIDYNYNKTEEEIANSCLIEYSHYTPNTLKAVVIDTRTTWLFVKMSVYGFKQSEVPPYYVSYVPEKMRSAYGHDWENDTEEERLRAQLNGLKRNGQASLASTREKMSRDGNMEYTVSTISGERRRGGAPATTWSFIVGLISFWSLAATLH